MVYPGSGQAQSRKWNRDKFEIKSGAKILLQQSILPEFLTLSKRVRIMISPQADVAELADAQVSEACDGDIVEVQVLSSAPSCDESEPDEGLAFFFA